MSVSWFAGIVCLAGLISTRSAAIYWVVAFCLFGSMAAVTLPGGAILLPSVLFLPFVVLRAWTEQHGKHYSRRIPIAGMWLALVVLWGVVGAFFLPRIFAGTIEVVAIDRSSGTGGISIGPIGPVSGNITQSGYAIGGLLTFLSIHALLEKPGRITQFRDAVLLVASLNCTAAMINIAEFRLGFPKVLDFVRTAYTLFGDYEVAGTGMMRIHGTFSEAAAFSGFTLPLFAFTFSLWLHRVRPWYSGLLSAVLLTFLLISTSTTAYVGLALYSVLLGFILTYRGYVRGVIPRIGFLVAGGLLVTVSIGSTFVFETEISQSLEAYLSRTVFTKMESASGIERAYWNRQAFSNFVDTYGIGVGLGTVRSSSYILILLSNLGVVGTLFFFAFLRRLFIDPRGTTQLEPVSEASRQAILATLAAALAAGTIFDLGIMFYCHAATACTYARAAWFNQDVRSERRTRTNDDRAPAQFIT